MVIPDDLLTESGHSNEQQPDQDDGGIEDDEGLITDPDTEIPSIESLLITVSYCFTSLRHDLYIIISQDS